VTAEDIVKRFRPRTKDRTLVLVGRITAGIVILLAMLWSTQGGRFTSIFVAINKIPMMFAPAITTVFLMGVFWKRGTKEAALATLLGGAVLGGLYFLIDLPVFGDVQWVSDPVRGLGIPFMMAGLILFIFCVTLYVIVSLLTPRPAEDQLTDLCWGKPSKAIMRGRITGPTDPRVMAGILVVIMIILYIIFH
jgi:SSS family solute:Na+ symporter